MKAVVSGQAGVALLWDGNRLSSLHAGVDRPPVPRRPREIPLLLGAANDLEFLDRIERPQVAQKLARACDEADALHLALILLDATLPFDIRREASLDLEELLGGPGVREHLERTFYARPLPDEADLAGALAHRAGQTPEVEAFLRSLSALQIEITEIAGAWREIPTEVFSSNDEYSEAQVAAVRGGLFRDLVKARAGEGDSFWMKCLLHPSVPGLKNQRLVLQAWLSPFREEYRSRLLTGEGSDEEFESLCRGPQPLLSTVLDSERLALIARELNALPEQMRRCVVLRFQYASKYREISAVTGIAIDTVKAHLSQARKRLQAALGPDFDVPENDDV